jgi:predicted nucleotidyltransferase
MGWKGEDSRIGHNENCRRVSESMAFRAASDPRLARHLRAGAIQAFEFTYELSFKTLRRFPGDPAIVRSILAAGLPPDTRIWVFGSRATGATKASCDLDLAIDAGRRLTEEERSALREAFEDPDLPYTVDVVDWATVSEAFRKIIERDRLAMPLPRGNCRQVTSDG